MRQGGWLLLLFTRLNKYALLQTITHTRSRGQRQKTAVPAELCSRVWRQRPSGAIHNPARERLAAEPVVAAMADGLVPTGLMCWILCRSPRFHGPAMMVVEPSQVTKKQQFIVVWCLSLFATLPVATRNRAGPRQIQQQLEEEARRHAER